MTTEGRPDWARPAFPTPGDCMAEPGLDKFDYLVAHAPPPPPVWMHGYGGVENAPAAYAAWACEWARAVVKELGKS